MIKETKERLKTIDHEMAIIGKYLKTAPAGRISCAKIGERLQIYHLTGSRKDNTYKSRYLRVDQHALAVELAKKEYLKKRLSDLDYERKILTEFIKKYSTDRETEYFKKRSPLVFELVGESYMQKSQELSEWESMPYQSHPKNYTERQVPTIKGFMVSSKSEAFIADELARRGFAIHYEEDVNLGGAYYNADFVVRHPLTGKVIVMEHFGMMDDENYRRKAAEKIFHYILAGYTPGIDAIFTYEDKDNPMSTARIRKTFDFYFGTY